MTARRGSCRSCPIAIIGSIAVARAIRRTTLPLSQVMDAADRVAEGDYAVRVEPHGAHEVRRLADSFNAMTERLETGDRLRRDLLADVAHELRTPLAVVQGNVEGMVDGVYQPDAEHLGVVLDGTRAIARLLDDLFTLSTAEAGALRLHREALDPARVVRDAVAAFAAQAEQATVSLTAHAEDGLPAVDADPIRLDQVLGNLIRNALQHTPAGGSVEVAAAAAPGGRVRFRVTDSGTGIAAEQLASVFERYVRSDSSAGAGLGLAIARRLVEAHGGTIHAESTPGAGTTITFELPAGCTLHGTGRGRSRARGPCGLPATGRAPRGCRDARPPRAARVAHAPPAGPNPIAGPPSVGTMRWRIQRLGPSTKPSRRIAFAEGSGMTRVRPEAAQHVLVVDRAVAEVEQRRGTRGGATSRPRVGAPGAARATRRYDAVGTFASLTHSGGGGLRAPRCPGRERRPRRTPRTGRLLQPRRGCARDQLEAAPRASGLAGIAGSCPPPVPSPAAVAVFAATTGFWRRASRRGRRRSRRRWSRTSLPDGAAINVLARQVGATVTVVDVGVATDLEPAPGLPGAQGPRGDGRPVGGSGDVGRGGRRRAGRGRAGGRRARRRRREVPGHRRDGHRQHDGSGRGHRARSPGAPPRR